MRLILISNVYPDEQFPERGVFVKNIWDGLRRYFNDSNLIVLKFTTNKIFKVYSYFRFYFQVFACCYKAERAFVYVHFISHCAIPILLSRLVNKKGFCLICHAHGADVMPERGTNVIYRVIIEFLSKRLAKESDSIIVPSTYFSEIAENKWKISQQKIFVSPSGGVNTRIFSVQTGLARRSKSELTIGFVGRLIPDKGIIDFLEILKVMRNSDISIRAIVVGDGPLRSKVEDGKLSEKIEYIPSVAQVGLTNIYNRMDILIFPTRRFGESLGLVGLEALFCSRPVLAYQGFGPDTYIQNGINGFLVPPGDIAQIKKILETLVEDSDKLNKLSQNARVSVQDYDSEIVCDKLYSYFLRLVHD